MAAITNLERANEANLLWPPIAQAVDTYLKRKDGNADGYERTWRLIHIWEAVTLTLGAAAATRVREPDGDAGAFLRCREIYHGRKWDPLTTSFNRYSGALDGSASSRINVLWEFGTRDITRPFLASLRQFLTAEAIDLSGLVREWLRVCDVPPDARNPGRHQVREALRHVNTLRNRFAHVPFPYDCMDGIAGALEEVTGQLFGTDPTPWQLLTKEERLENPLTGAFIHRGRLLVGNSWRREGPTTDHLVSFTFPPVAKKAVAPEIWNANPFVFVDSMGRPHVLTRVLSETSGAIELTRFQAEANSVVVRDDPAWASQFPLPTQNEYEAEDSDAEADDAAHTVQVAGPTDDAGAPTQRRTMGHDEALRLVRNEQFEPAIAYFAEVAKAEPQYHIAWLRLGHAQREMAMRLRDSAPDRARALFDDSITALEMATGHVSAPRRAQAHYERSKSLYQRWRFVNESRRDYDEAVAEAERAFHVSPDTTFESWLAYLRSHGPDQLHQAS